MNTQQRWLIVGLVVAGVLLAQTPLAGAATSTGSGFYLEELGVKIFNLCKNVVVPLVLLLAVCTIGGGVCFSMYQIGPKMMHFLAGCAILAGGVETVLLLVGGQVATAALL
jgi:hypothetical protein